MNFFGRLALGAVERPRAAIAAAAFLALLGVVAALRLAPDTSADTVVDRGSDAYAATERFREDFGGDALVVLVEGDLGRLLLTENLGTLLGLEGCLAGTAPEGTVFVDAPAPDGCAELAELKPARVVFGPATFLREAADRANELLAEQAQVAIAQAQAVRQQVEQRALENGQDPESAAEAGEIAAQSVIEQLQGELLQVAVKYGQTGQPRIDDTRFVSAVVFDDSLPGRTPKARFSYLFPGPEAALTTIRLRPDLEPDERKRAIELVREVVEQPEFELDGGSYVVSGVPAVTEGLADILTRELAILLVLAIAVMAIALGLALGPPARLAPLAIALAACAVVFGASSLLGGTLSLALVAVLPVLVGLAVDYGIQLQARFREGLDSGLTPDRAAVAAAESWGPVLGVAALATVAGFAVLVLSPLPIIRQFGLLLGSGIAVGLGISMTVGVALLSLSRGQATEPGRRSGRAGTGRLAAAQAALARAGARVGSAFDRVGDATGRAARASLATAVSAPRRVVLVAAILAIAGWVAGTRTEVVSDIRELVPGDLAELEAIDELQGSTGVSGEIDVVVRGEGVTRPAAIEWMGQAKEEMLEAGGFDEDVRSCRDSDAQLCPAAALPDLFGDAESPGRGQIRAVLAAVPDYFSQAVLSKADGDGERAAALAFGIRVMPLDEQKELVEEIRSIIAGEGGVGPPPEGLDAELVGLPVLAADANASLSAARHWLPAAGLLAVALALIAVRRSVRRTVVPLIPIALATGWSALVIAAMGVPLNPMSATLGALVVAIATEFSVILEARYRDERLAGSAPGAALRRTFERTGRAVVASGVTAIAGFAVLISSQVEMLRDFGIVTVVDLAAALLGVLIVLPAALVWAEDGLGLRRLLARRPRRPRLGRLRRRRQTATAEDG